MMTKALLVVALLGLAAASSEKVTPVQKVIELMKGMIDKGNKEKEDEQIQFSAFKAFCDSTAAEKTKAISDANDKVEVLQADIQKAEADAEGLGKEVATLDEDISTWEADFKAATKVRTIENNDYTATHADYTSSIDALAKGIDTLKKQNKDLAQAGLIQIKEASFISEPAKKAIDQFLASDPSVRDENLAVAGPAAKGFESQLQGIIDMLTGLASKFEDERTTLEKEETEAKHGYDMLAMDLKGQIAAATEARTEKAEKKASSLQSAADSKGDLTDTATTRDDDAKYLQDMVTTCELKSSAFADRQTLRTEEIEAINKAIEILAGGAVSGASEKHLPQLLQNKVTSFANLRSDVQSPSQHRVAAFLKAASTRLNSRVLAFVALKAGADPFKKVKKMIKDLIVKLMEEATEEAETKGFCDTELSTNEHTRKEKTAQVESLTADIDELTASIAVLTEEIASLNEQLAASQAAVEKATDIRMAEKKKNKETISDAQDAQAAVAQALGVLKDFYEKAGKATALYQRSRQPAIFDDTPYKGLGGESGGVVGMIEVIASDFARLESETAASEQASADEYKKFMQDTKMDTTMMTKDVEHKTESKADQENNLQEKKTDLDGTQKELDAAMKYFDKLKPTCVSGGSESFEDRTAQRKEEVESLQEALRILNGEDIAFLQE